METVKSHNVEAVEAILKNPAFGKLNLNFRTENAEEKTAIHLASEAGDLEILKLLLAHPSVDLTIFNPWKFTALHFACKEGWSDVVEYLLQFEKVDVNAITNGDFTPLWIAARFGRLATIKSLIVKGREKVDILGKAAWGEESFTAAEVAGKLGFHEVSSLLDSYEKDPAGVLQQLTTEFALQGSFFSFFDRLPLRVRKQLFTWFCRVLSKAACSRYPSGALRK